MEAEFLYGIPQHEIASQISEYIRKAKRFSIVVGFITEEGVALLESAIKSNMKSLESIIIGSCTYKALDAFDRLIGMGVSREKLYLHLGFSRNSTGKSAFIQYHPMMHSKIYLFEFERKSVALVGSHNITGFALSGQNGEASVRLEFENNQKMYYDIKNHINEAVGESVNYEPNMKLAYAWWYRQYTEGLLSKILYRMGDDGVENKSTVLAIALNSNKEYMPKIGGIVYMEIPESLRALNFIGEQVHLYVLEVLPKDPHQALLEMHEYEHAFYANVIGTNTGGVVKQGKTDWIIRDFRSPVLEKISGNFNTNPNSTNVQVFIEIKGIMRERYDYLFESTPKWEPVYAYDDKIVLLEEYQKIFANLNLIPPEDKPWQRVVGLRPVETDLKISQERQQALLAALPNAGRYIMYSRRRRKLQRNR